MVIFEEKLATKYARLHIFEKGEIFSSNFNFRGNFEIRVSEMQKRPEKSHK